MKNLMKNLFLLALTVSLGVSAYAQGETTSFSKSLGLFVFPNNDQDQATQSADEAYCYNWAREQTNYDPINPTKVEVEQVETGPDGSAIVGGAKGAAAGAAIGAIAGDAGKGAAIGAVAGGLAGRRASRAHNQQEQKQNVETATAASDKMADDFKKAFMACMDAKEYTVK